MVRVTGRRERKQQWKENEGRGGAKVQQQIGGWWARLAGTGWGVPCVTRILCVVC